MTLFSVVIPTLQRSPTLPELLRRLSQSSSVAEIMVINNSSSPLSARPPRTDVIEPGRNIFVNPAWNLGVASTNAPLVCLCNDDALFDPRILDAIARRLRRGAGIVGPHSSCFRPISVDPRASRSLLPTVFLPAYVRPFGFGTLMSFRRESFVPIPDDLKIWCGDDYLFQRQQQRNYCFFGPKILTTMSLTSSSHEFDRERETDIMAMATNYPENHYRRRYWKEYRWLLRYKEVRQRLFSSRAERRNSPQGRAGD